MELPQLVGRRCFRSQGRAESRPVPSLGVTTTGMLMDHGWLLQWWRVPNLFLGTFDVEPSMDAEKLVGFFEEMTIFFIDSLPVKSTRFFFDSYPFGILAKIVPETPTMKG